jgi:hypothetical protein
VSAAFRRARYAACPPCAQSSNPKHGRLKEESVTKFVRELNNLVSLWSSSDFLYQNILSTCTAFLSDATVLERAPSD